MNGNNAKRRTLSALCFIASCASVGYAFYLWDTGISRGDSSTSMTSLVAMFLGGPAMLGAGIAVIYGLKWGFITAFAVGVASYLAFLSTLVTC